MSIAGCAAMLAIVSGAQRPAAAQAAAPASGRIATATRLVVQYSEIEQKLNAAIQHRDQAALNKLLSDDFEEWTPAPPGDPIAREDWLKRVLDPGFFKAAEIRQMAVRTVDHTDVVSFIETRRGPCGSMRGCNYNSFIVDLWRENGGNPRLLVRYRSEVPTMAWSGLAPVPAKPTGRE